MPGFRGFSGINVPTLRMPTFAPAEQGPSPLAVAGQAIGAGLTQGFKARAEREAEDRKYAQEQLMQERKMSEGRFTPVTALDDMGTPTVFSFNRETGRVADVIGGQVPKQFRPVVTTIPTGPGGERQGGFIDDQGNWVPLGTGLPASGYLAGRIGRYDPKRLLSPNENILFGTPQGTTMEGAMGLQPISPGQREKTTAYNAAKAIIADIARYASQVPSGQPGIGRFVQGAKNLFGAVTQTDPNAAMLMSKHGEIGNLIRALGEVGTLTDQDVARVRRLIPGLADTAQIKSQKIQDLNALVDEIASRRVESFTRQFPGVSSPRQPVPPPASPSGGGSGYNMVSPTTGKRFKVIGEP